jgi:phage terminase large subunit-like protein
MFDVREAREMSTDLIADAVPCIEIPQTSPGVNGATRKLIALVATGNLVQGGNPVMAHSFITG